MQELQSFNFSEECKDRNIDFQVKEKDMDDSIVYEIFSGNNYLATFSKEGKIIFDNTEKTEIDNSCINKIIQKLKQKLNM
jgi:hypothetical protein